MAARQEMSCKECIRQPIQHQTLTWIHLGCKHLRNTAASIDIRQTVAASFLLNPGYFCCSHCHCITTPAFGSSLEGQNAKKDHQLFSTIFAICCFFEHLADLERHVCEQGTDCSSLWSMFAYAYCCFLSAFPSISGEADGNNVDMDDDEDDVAFLTKKGNHLSWGNAVMRVLH